MIILIDFDGTCVTHDFPNIGKDIGAVPVLKRLVERGHKLILWTVRSDKQDFDKIEIPGIMNVKGLFLTDAINWFKENGIELYSVLENPEQKSWSKSPKAYAHLCIDDINLGCPLKYDPEYHHLPFVDWKRVEKMLEDNNII